MLLLKKTLYKNWYYFLFSPIFFNFVINLFQKNNNLLIKINFFNLISTILLFSLFLFFGICIQNVFNLEYIHSGITLFLLSFLIIDLIILFFNKNVTFLTNTFLVISLWLIIFLLKKVNKFYLLISYFLLAINILFNQLFLDRYIKNPNIKVDAWYYIEFSKNIYNNNFFYSMNNNIFTGYSQISSYFHSLIYNLSLNSSEYIYYRHTTNLLFFLMLLLLIEVSKQKGVKLFAPLLFSSIVLNSDWLSFLMFDSLMSEGILNYLFCSSLLSATSRGKSTKNIGLICLGMLVFTKQFYITLILILSILSLISKNFRKNSIYLFFGIMLKEVVFATYFNNIAKDHHIRQIDLKDTLFDFLLMRDLKPENIIKIIQNLLKDIPLSYLLTLIFFLYLTAVFYRTVDLKSTLFLSLILINFLLIFAIYISVWRNMELESPIRFILNLFLLKLVLIDRLVFKINAKFNSKTI